MAFTYEINGADDIDFALRSLRADVESGIDHFDGLKISLEPIDEE